MHNDEKKEKHMTDIKKYKEKYRHIENLDSGGQGFTFIASHKDGQTRLLIKLLKRQNDDERRARMYREVVAMETLQNNFIPKVIDSNVEYYKNKEYDLFIAMELVDGETLYSFVNKNSETSLEDKIYFAKVLLETLDYCHSIGIIHRDIKPDNIVLHESNIKKPYLIDFGLSFNKDEIERITPADQILGNRFLFLPELGKNSQNKNDIRADITMVIGLIYYLIIGEEPGHLVDENGILPHQREFNNLSEREKEELKRFSFLFDIGFQSNINNRFQTISEVIKELDLILNPKLNFENFSSELENFKVRRFSNHVNEYLQNENLMKRLLGIIIKSFENVVIELNYSVRLIEIKNSINSDSCWCAYTIQDNFKSQNSLFVKIEARISGEFILLTGGEVEFHGNFIGEKDRISRIKIKEFEQFDFSVIFKYLMTNVLKKYLI
jgi:serine/threonine protein kinase